MSKTLRLSEKWFHRGLWLVAFLFAWFLVGLGSTIVGDLPQVETYRSLDDYLDPARAPAVKEAILVAQKNAKDAQAALDQAQLRQQSAEANNRAARETFSNWLATRQATARPEQDEELIARTKQLDELRQAERDALALVEKQQQAALDARQAEERAQAELQTLQDSARDEYMSEQRAQELRVFGYRLALTLPLLAAAGWLFAKKRKTSSWPFVWGFIIFALFAFFVELVPYLPSYGGYVRYVVGIGITVLVGRYAILALNRYLERQRLAESLPDAQRREELGYDVVMARLGKSVCPGCERAVDLKNEAIDYCPHCGLCLFDRCGHCSTRKNAFSRYCFSCGTPSTAESATDSAAQGVAQMPPGAAAGRPAGPARP